MGSKRPHPDSDEADRRNERETSYHSQGNEFDEDAQAERNRDGYDTEGLYREDKSGGVVQERRSCSLRAKEGKFKGRTIPKSQKFASHHTIG